MCHFGMEKCEPILLFIPFILTDIHVWTVSISNANFLMVQISLKCQLCNGNQMHED